MYDWMAANWIWILLGVGVLWFMFRRGGMGCGMGGHGSHGGEGSEAKELPSGVASSGMDHDEGQKRHAPSTRGSYRHGGCC